MECKLCKSISLKVFTISLYSVEGNWLTPVYRCENCNSYMRDFDYSFPGFKQHLALSTYTNLAYENRLKREKENYFQIIADRCLLTNDFHYKSCVLDLGSCFGHFLDIFYAKGLITYGVEPFDPLYDLVLSRGKHSIFRSINALTSGLSFDVIAIMDTLYLLEDPVSTLIKLRKMINKNGILVIRIVNRVWFLEALRFLGIPVKDSTYGDHKFSFSRKGMQALLKSSGFQISSIVGRESGKKISGLKYRLLGKLLQIVSILPGVNLSPGLIYYCRPMGNTCSQKS